MTTGQPETRAGDCAAAPHSAGIECQVPITFGDGS